MPRYARLNESAFEADDSDLFEVDDVAMTFIGKIAEAERDLVLAHPSEAERAEQQKSIRDGIYNVPSTEILSPTKLEFPKGSTENCRGQVQQYKQDQQQNIENGNPNVCPPDPTTQPAVVAICSRSSTASAASLQEQQGGVRGGASHSGRWVGRTTEDRSNRWRVTGHESYRSDNATSVVDNASNSNFSVSSARGRGCQWTPSVQRVTTFREPAVDHHSRQDPFLFRVGAQAQYSQPQETQSCALHTSCNDGRYCQRFSKESSPVDSQFSIPIPGPEKTTLSSVMHSRPDATPGGCVSQEKSAVFQRRDTPGLQRSSSTKDTPGQRSEMSIENWRDHPASRSAHVTTKHRVSFSLTENHELETQKQREKWKEPNAHSKKILGAKYHCNQQQQPLRYNYEQPGFVEREKENLCGGKAYTIYGVKEVKECPRGSSGRHHPGFVRAFSLRENGSNYSKMPRAYSVNAGGRHVMPMECDTCGKGGIGIVFLGLPGDDANFCKACKSSQSCSNKPQKKKKSIMQYCRKLLRFPQKSS